MKYDPNDSEHTALKAQTFYENRYRAVLRAHPKCSDPDHPGCHLCEEDEEDDDIQTYADDKDDIQKYE